MKMTLNKSISFKWMRSEDERFHTRKKNQMFHFEWGRISRLETKGRKRHANTQKNNRLKWSSIEDSIKLRASLCCVTYKILHNHSSLDRESLIHVFAPMVAAILKHFHAYIVPLFNVLEVALLTAVRNVESIHDIVFMWHYPMHAFITIKWYGFDAMCSL